MISYPIYECQYISVYSIFISAEKAIAKLYKRAMARIRNWCNKIPHRPTTPFKNIHENYLKHSIAEIIVNGFLAWSWSQISLTLCITPSISKAVMLCKISWTLDPLIHDFFMCLILSIVPWKTLLLFHSLDLSNFHSSCDLHFLSSVLGLTISDHIEKEKGWQIKDISTALWRRKKKKNIR